MWDSSLTAQNDELRLSLIDLEGDVEIFAVIKGADVLCAALLSAALGPYLVVRVLGELAESIATVIGRDIALHRERVAVLEINGGAFEAGPGFIDNLTLDGAGGCGVLGEDGAGRRSHKPNGYRHGSKQRSR